MDIKQYVKQFDKSYEEVKNEYSSDFNDRYREEEEWLGNLEDKIHLLKSPSDEEQIKQVITKLKNNQKFLEPDTKLLTTFTSKINKIVNIADRINNFKEGTKLDNDKSLKLFELFNQIQMAQNFAKLNIQLNANLKNFIPHLFSVIKHCQNPTEYPIYYKYWKNILREVLSKSDDYDSMCLYYKEFPTHNRHLHFAAYLGTIGIQIARQISNSGITFNKTSKQYKYLKNRVINIDRYIKILDDNMNLDETDAEKSHTTQYWLYAPGNNAEFWGEFYENGIMGLGWDELGDLNNYSSKEEIVKELQQLENTASSKKNDATANYEFKNNINIGDVIIVKKGRSQLLGFGVVESDYYYDTNRTSFQKCRKVDWQLRGHWEVDHSLALKTLTDLTNYDSSDPLYSKYYEQLLELMRESKSTRNFKEEFVIWINNKFKDSSGAIHSYLTAIDLLSQVLGYKIYETDDIKKLQLLYNDLLKEQKNESGKYFNKDAPSYGKNGFYSASIKSYIEFHEEYNSMQTSESSFDAPLNMILYGPPGTGKTYSTVKRAAEIVSNRNIDNYEEALDIFNSNLHDQVEFITFHQNYSYEDFIQGLRPETDNSSSLIFAKKDGVFKQISDRAIENLRLSLKAPKDVAGEVAFQSAIRAFGDKIEDSGEVFPITDSAYIYEIEEDAFRYTGAKWTTHASGLRMKFRDLFEFFRNNVESRIEVRSLKSISGLAKQHATYYFSVYKEILKVLPKKVDSSTKVLRKNYVLIIDEINRANISRVFGELITLIEPDKRSHGAIPLEARLPSGDSFIVPSNLYIIGTMNTADKSIALLDIALRRRFEFESMYPKYEFNGQQIPDAEILQKINNEIIKSKGHDFQIGHAYFMDHSQDLVQRMTKKVIPLLLEYFMNDEKEVKKILLSAGLKLEEGAWPIRITGKND